MGCVVPGPSWALPPSPQTSCTFHPSFLLSSAWECWHFNSSQCWLYMRIFECLNYFGFLVLKLSPSDFDVQWGLRTSALARSWVGFDRENHRGAKETRKLFTWCPTAPYPPWGQSQCELNVNWTHWEDQGTIKKQISQWRIHGTFCKGINKLPSGPAILPLAFKSL